VGDGSDTYFWTDPWVEGIRLCERFERLFDLAETKSHSVAEMFSLGWGRWGGVGVAEEVAGVAGGDVGGVSDFNSYLSSSGTVFR
jgi:hypothetical protein